MIESEKLFISKLINEDLSKYKLLIADVMLKAFNFYKMPSSCLYLGISISNRYLSKSLTLLKSNPTRNISLIALVALNLASKYLDRSPFKIS